MSSSTSSSEAVEAPVAVAPLGRRFFARILAAILLWTGASYGVLNLFVAANDASAETILTRVYEARAALPRILDQQEDLVMAFGSSMTQSGFAARQFDRQMAEHGVTVKSYNFGFGGLNPYFQDYLSRRIRDAFQERDRRLELAMIELVPFQVTEARWNGAQDVVDGFVSMLATPPELWSLTLEDPTRGIRMLNIHYLRNNISAEMITSYYARPFQPPRAQSDLPENEEAMAELREVGQKLSEKFEQEYPDYESKAWDWPWQGAGTIPEERSEETLELFTRYYELTRQPKLLADDEVNRINCCDIEELHFEPVLVESFVRIVKNFQEFSDHVEVVLYPRNLEWIRYSPEARARLQAVLDRIHDETGVTIRNFQELDTVTPEMFGDTTHLARYSGDVAFTGHLVDVYAPLLGGF